MKTPELFKNHIKPLDGLRGLSIVLVVFSHFCNSVGAPSWLQEAREIKVGQLGVELFFFISGFLISGLLLKEKTEKGKVDLKAFYWRRLIRIFPVFYTFLIVVVILSFTIAHQIPGRMFIPPFFYFSNFDTPFGGSWELGHSWSLSVEEQFYLLWPLSLLALTRIKKIGPILLIIVFYHIAAKVLAYELKSPNFMLNPFTGYLPPLLSGSFLSYYLFKNEEKCRSFFTYNSILIVPGVFMLMVVLEYFPGHGLLGPIFLPFGTLIISFLLVLFFGYILLSKNKFWASILSKKGIRFIGVVSYSWYIWQQLFLGHYLFFYKVPVLNKYPYNLFFSFVTAVISYYTVEKFFLKFKKYVANTEFKRKFNESFKMDGELLKV